ncbi:MAG: FdtA/QdtA family cupin domain-containing protein [Oscillospiraceae bacterium]|nr:FdtA/QdtA family cupin domain-containing protein [Oscillospiraceae bacterium]
MIGRIATLNRFFDDDGILVCMENGDTLPFAIERLFYITGVSGQATRGNHASHNAKMAFIALNGNITIELNDGVNSEVYLMQKQTEILLVEKMTWIVAKDFSKDAILLVVSDKRYKDCDYITDYLEYKRLKEEKE